MPASQAGRRRFESGRPLQFFGKGLRDIEPVTPWRLYRGFRRIPTVKEPSYDPTCGAALSKAEPSWLVAHLPSPSALGALHPARVAGELKIEALPGHAAGDPVQCQSRSR